MSEGVVVRWVRNMAPAWWPGGHIIRQNSGRKGGVSFGELGMPDFIGFDHTGQALAIECKTSVGRLSEDQVMWLADAHRKGVRCYVAVGSPRDESPPKLYEWGTTPERNLPRPKVRR